MLKIAKAISEAENTGFSSLRNATTSRGGKGALYAIPIMDSITQNIEPIPAQFK